MEDPNTQKTSYYRKPLKVSEPDKNEMRTEPWETSRGRLSVGTAIRHRGKVNDAESLYRHPRHSLNNGGQHWGNRRGKIFLR